MKKEIDHFKTVKPVKLILYQKWYIGDEKLNMCRLRTISSEKKIQIQKKQYRCQLWNFRAKKETFFEPKKTG